MPSFVYENKLRRQGFKVIAGVDEVGRGPLAGPIVAAAVILPQKLFLPGLRDSKLLSSARREKLFSLIIAQALAWSIARIGQREIDRLNIGKANELVLQKAIEKLKLIPDFVLVDGNRRIFGINLPQRTIIGGDNISASIAAASIVAKVIRDRLMDEFHAQFPLYGFDRHKGYGTREHLRKIKELGPCPIHRRSFSPVKELDCRG